MAIDKLMNQTQGEDIISKLGDIATTLENVTTVEPAKFGMGYAVCNTAAGTAAKTANIANYTLTEGALVTVKFTNGNTASNATLNISSTGAKPLLYKGSALTSDIISADDICTFIYSTANSGSYNIINVDALSGAGAGTVKSVGAEGGITTDQTSGAAISTIGSVKLNLKSNTTYTGTVADPATTNKVYPVALDGDGHPCVGVPWTDTTYTQASNSAITVNNTDHTIDVAVGAVGTKGVVELSTSIPATGAVDTKVATEKAVADSISGKAIGANSSTTNAIATFAGTDGKTLADSAVTIAKDTTGVTDDDTKVPTSKAVKTYVDATATGISRYIGTITATSQLSTTAKKGDFYIVSTAWTGVHVGDEIIAEKNSPAQTIDGTNWTLLHNEADTNTTYAFAEGTDNGKFTVTPSDTGTAQSVTVHGLKSAAYTESTAYATSSHVHGNITNAGALQTTDVSIATGDKLVVTDASDSNKVARTSAAFDTTVTTKCLTQAGTFADFNNYTHPTTAGNKHIPTSGATGNYLKYGGSSGTASWAAPLTAWPATPTNTDTLPSTKLIADRFTTNESNILSVEDMVCATEFSSSTAYAVGDMVTYEHKLYKFINAHQGAWSASDVQNYDLTRLEAEDRASLAEVVDSGAKNLVPMTWTNTDPFTDIHMTKNSDGSISVTATNTAATRIIELATNLNNYLTAGKNYVLSGCDGGDYNNHYGFALSTSNYTGRVFEANGSEEFTYASEVVNFTLVVRAGESWTKTFKPMVCTKAAFGVSPKFVPYTKSNSQLTTELGSVKTVLEAIL